ncbi:MAG TPA: hypothetical protein VKE42_02305, partial [Candidatus Cybelea sp.]|nr:hypothetical protein [Candidatus Cybelea sp.]
MTQQQRRNKYLQSLGRFRTNNGNCFMSGPGSPRGWQLFCPRCGAHSKPIGASKQHNLPHDFFTRKFAQMGWFVGNSPGEDRCPQCSIAPAHATRVEQPKERNTLEYLRGLIRRLDDLLSRNVALQGTAELVSDFGSLLATAYLVGIVPPQWQERGEEPAPFVPFFPE